MNLLKFEGVGKKRLELLNQMGIYSVNDLVFHFPKSYIDSLNPCPIIEAQEDIPLCFSGILQTAPSTGYFGKKTRSSAKFADDTGEVSVYWFNQPWIGKTYKKGDSLMFYGRLSYFKGRAMLINPKRIDRKEIVAEYKLIKGISQSLFKSLVQKAFEILKLDEYLPKELVLGQSLMSLKQALFAMHFPQNMNELKSAKNRFAFEDLLLYQLLVKRLRGDKKEGLIFNADISDIAEFEKNLPFNFTSGQIKAAEDTVKDLISGKAMNRLVQGDVGAGKTVIAFLCVYLAKKSGYQAAIMAPTEILAVQHAKNAEKLLSPLGIKTALLLGSMSEKQKREQRALIESGEADIIFGTHALISPSVKYNRLALVVCDEQHRFGVRQRKLLSDKADIVPHVLVMSATPIPRTLALILYGDLDVSVIDTLPPNRKPVSTHIVPDSKIEGMYDFIREHINKGEQVYIVCPLIEDDENDDEKTSAVNLYNSLTKGEFKDIKTGLLYGTQSADEKQKALDSFRDGDTRLIISTSVIEVGVDVKNASIMAIMHANRFGLSQLHQLRGRVGRGDKQSYCFLVGKENKRLKTLVKTNDGFEIAKQDLELRGPGEILGTMQHGRVDIVSDIRLLYETRDLAEKIANGELYNSSKDILFELAQEKYKKSLDATALN